MLFNSCSEKHGKEALMAIGTVEHIDSFGSAYVIPRDIDILLPRDYSDQKRYAVIYMHDGQMLFDSTTTWNNQEWGIDEAMHTLLKEDKIIPTIVVGISSTRLRHSEYFPQKPFNCLEQNYRDSLITNGRRDDGSPIFSTDILSDNYLKFIVQELKPYIDKRYATWTDVEHTFIAGSSMGGLISMYAICEYPSIFSGAACLSTHWTGIFQVENNPIPHCFMNYLKDHLPSPEHHKLYFDFGTETLDAMYEPFQQQVDVILKNKGFTQKTWKTLKFIGDDHSENTWRKRIDIPLTFLLNKELIM